MEKIEYFLRNVFDYLDRYTEFTERPMADERHWVGLDAPVVHLIFMDDVVVRRPITAHYVTLFVTGQVFSLEQYVDACVKVLQSLREEDIPDAVIDYVNMLVNVYATNLEGMRPARTEPHPLAEAPVKEVEPAAAESGPEDEGILTDIDDAVTYEGAKPPTHPVEPGPESVRKEAHGWK